MKLSQKSIAVLVVVILFGGVFISDALGVWHTESTKVPRKIETGAFAGSGDPADIRGSYTFGDIEKVFPITAETLGEVFWITENPESFQLKRLEAMYPSEGEFEMGTSSVRYFVARYTGLPYEQTGEEGLFPIAIEFLKREGKISEEEAQTIPVMNPEIILQHEDAPEETIVEEHVEPLVKGNTIVADLFSLGLSKEEIITVIGEYGSEGELVRDVCNSNDIAFSEAKLTLQELAEE